jgi:hypothetical protein
MHHHSALDQPGAKRALAGPLLRHAFSGRLTSAMREAFTTLPEER